MTGRLPRGRRCRPFITAAPDGARHAADRIRRIEKLYRETIKDEVNPTASGVEILEIDPLQAAEILSN